MGGFRLLAQHGADLQYARSNDGQTPLHSLCSSENTTIDQMSLFRRLLRMGQDPFARDKEYKCPLGIIIERGLAYLVEVFAIMNINPNISVSGPRTDRGRRTTALHIACKKSQKRITQLLLEAKGDP